MNEERQLVLAMLRDGKISVEDAERLLSAVGKNEERGADGRGWERDAWRQARDRERDAKHEARDRSRGRRGLFGEDWQERLQEIVKTGQEEALAAAETA